jgi:regulatory factor X, other
MVLRKILARHRRAQGADSSIDDSSKSYDTMADRSRSPSATTASQRPPSRDSTTSLHSVQTQFPPTDNAHVPQPQQQQVPTAQPVQNQYQGVPAGDMAALLQGAQEFNMPQGGENVITDFQPHSTQQHGVSNGYYPPPSQSYSHQQAPSQQPVPFSNNFNALNSVRSISVPPQEVFKMEDQTKKPPSATATNDRELRELLTRNRGRSLQDVASEVIATERTSKSERTKQLFAMLW